MEHDFAGNSSHPYDYDDSGDGSGDGSGSGEGPDGPSNVADYYMPLGFAAVLIVLVNGFIIFLICRNSKLRTNCNALLVSLAVADCTTGLIGIPLLMVAGLEIVSDDKMCYMNLAVHTWFWVLAVCTMLHLLVITCEQYFTILKPFSHDKIVNKTSVTITLTFIWAVSVGHALIPWIWLLPLGDNFCTTDDKEMHERDKVFSLASTAICFLFPVSIIIYAYFRIVLEARRHIVRIKQDNRASKGHRQLSPCGRFRGFYMIALMWTVFVLCWAPYFIVVCLVTVEESQADFEFDYIITVLRFLPSFLNPLMFTCWKSDLRTACIDVFSCCAKKRRDQPLLLNRLSDSKPTDSRTQTL